MLLPETRSTQGLTVSDIFCLLSSWLLSPSIHHTVGIIIISHYLYYSHSPSTCLCWVPQTCLKQISSTIPAVQSTASWGCWWAKSCADEAASLNIPTIPSDVVLVSRHTFFFSSNRILPERKSHCRHTAFSPPPILIHPEWTKVPPLNKSARIDSELNSKWIRVAAQCSRLSDNLTTL